MRTGYSKSEKMDPWVSKSEGKGTKSEPRDTKSEPKGSQREPKGDQNPPTLVVRVRALGTKGGEFTSPLPPSALGPLAANPSPQSA